MLLQTFADEGVELAEEALELWVVVGVAVDLVDRLEEVVEGGVVGESFQKGLY